MKKSVFSMLSARAALAIAAALLISLSSCKKEKPRPEPLHQDGVFMTTEKAVGGEIYLKFAIGDEPSVDGAKEIETKVEEGWLKKKYQLTAQDLTIKGKVTKLACSGSELKLLDTSKLPELTYLNCSENSLASLDVSNNTKLKELFCHNNSLNGESLELPALANEGMGILYFKYGAEDAQMLTEDEVKYIRENKNWAVKTHDSGDWDDYAGEERAIAMTTKKAVGDMIELEFAPGDKPAVEGAEEIETKVEEGWLKKKYRLTAQDLTIKGKVTKLDCNGNQLTSLDVSKNTELTELYCYNNPLTSLDVGGNTELTKLDCSNNTSLTSLDVRKNTKLTALICNNNSLSSLDVSKNTELTVLDCSKNSLTSLDVSKNAGLTYLDCDWNILTSLDVSRNTKLDILRCSYNSLTSLDVSGSTKLTELYCSYNSLTSLDVSGSTKLTKLECYKNKLTFEKLTLPKLSAEGKLYFKYTSDGDSQKLTADQVKEIKEKKWTVWQHKGKNWVNYPGE